MHAGHISQFRDRRRYIPICDIVSKVGKDICQNLPAAYAPARSDTTAAFFQIGKRTAYSKLADLVRVKPTILETFGLSNNVSEDYYGPNLCLTALFK